MFLQFCHWLQYAKYTNTGSKGCFPLCWWCFCPHRQAPAYSRLSSSWTGTWAFCFLADCPNHKYVQTWEGPSPLIITFFFFFSGYNFYSVYTCMESGITWSAAYSIFSVATRSLIYPYCTWNRITMCMSQNVHYTAGKVLFGFIKWNRILPWLSAYPYHLSNGYRSPEFTLECMVQQLL